MSIWKSFKHDIKELDKNIETDVLIIGGGLTGLMTAYYLKNKNVCIIEKSKLGEGVTKKTTAKITYFQGVVYTKISSLVGKSNAKLYLDSQIKAIKEYKKIIEKENIDCDFTHTPSYVFTNKKSEINKLEKEVKFLKKAGINVESSLLPIDTKHYTSYKVEDAFTFNPLKFLNGIYNILTQNDIPIYENTKATNVKKENGKYIVKCNDYEITAKKLVFACHYPYFIFPLALPLKSYIEKSYMYISKVKEYKNFSCISSNNPIYSCRFYKDGDDKYQISLGSSHNTAFKQNDEENFLKVKKQFNLKDEDIIMKYSNTDIMTPDYLPFIGKLKENMYIGCGYNTWGMTNSLLAGLIISDLIKCGVNEYIDLFNPKRINLANLVKLPLILFSSIKSYTTSKLIKNKNWYTKVKVENGIGIYTDEVGIEHKVKTKCPHMGCGLIFNEIEKTWDCPCHSSKFDIDGKCIKGPSNKDIKL